MQITTDTVAAAWIGWKEYSSKNKNALGEDLMRAALEAVLGAKADNAPEIVKALRSSATNTECDCFRCRAANCIEDLSDTLIHVITMDAYTRDGEEPAHEIMRACARDTLKRWGLK